MSSHVPERFDDLPILAEMRERLRTRFESTPPRRHRERLVRARRWRPLALIAVLVLGGTTGALAAAGVFQTGTPVGSFVLAQPNAFDGVAVPGSLRLLSLRVADPDGGPPWVLRALRTTRGLECVELGRLVGGKIGVIGEDGAFADDGRFHPLSANAFEFSFNCAALDAHGHAFTTDIAFGLPASALATDSQYGGCNPPQPSIRSSTRALARHIRRRRGPVCPSGSLRNVYFGMLGPDTKSITYTTADDTHTAPTAGPDGAYLVVLDDSGGPQGESGGPTLTDSSTNPIRAVSYTDGRACELPPPVPLAQQRAANLARLRAALQARFPTLAKLESGQIGQPGPAGARALAAALKITHSSAYREWRKAHQSLFAPSDVCPKVGYVPDEAERVPSAAVATPITVRVQTPKSLCTNGLQTIKACGAVAPPGLQRLPAGVAQRNAVVTLTWTSRIAITNQQSHYEVYFGATRPTANNECSSTSSGPTETDFTVGQKVTYTATMPLACPGISHGTVTLVQENSHNPNGQAPHTPVGTFNAVIP